MQIVYNTGMVLYLGATWIMTAVILSSTPRSSAGFSIISAIFGPLFFVSLLELVFGALLTHGVKKGNPRLILAWLIFTAIEFILVIVSTVAGLVLTRGANVFLFGYVLWLIVIIYLYSVVLSHRKTLLETETRGKSGANYQLDGRQSEIKFENLQNV